MSALRPTVLSVPGRVLTHPTVRRAVSWTPHGRTAVVFYAVLGVLSGGGLAARLFVGGAIGLSDQGDGTRLLCDLGLREGEPYGASRTDYLYLTWYHHQWWGETCGAIGSGEPYNSSQLWLLQLAKWLTPVLHLRGALDLRALGVVFCVLIALLMAGLAAVLPGPAVVRVLAVGATMLVVADGTFAGYFVSAYSEPAALVGILALAVATLIYWRAPRVRWWSLLLVGAATIFTITAKTQTASFLVAVVPLVLLRHSWGATLRARMSARTPPNEAWPLRPVPLEWLCSRWPALLLSAVLATVTVAYLGAQPKRFAVQNDYAAVFIEMLPHSPHPEQDLRQLGLPASMISSSGVAINAPGSAAQRLDFVDFTDHASPLQTTKVYLDGPRRLVTMMGRGLDGMGVLRADYLASYPASAGRPARSSECRVCVLQTAWKASIGRWSGLIVLLTLLAIAVSARLAVTRRDRAQSAVGVLGLLLSLSLMAQFWVVMLTEGASDLIKHLVFANFLTALLVVVTALAGYLLATTDPRPNG